MGTTLTGTTPQDTYDSLIKVTDNGPLSSTAKYLSDGLGNDSALALSTAGVGVGTTTISSVGSTKVLEVGTTASGGTLTLGGSTAFRISGSTSGVDMYYAASAPINIYTAGTERVRIDATGNVGIGTSSPNAKLKVQGTGDLSFIYNSGASTSDANFYIHNATQDHFIVRNSGNVGIGTASPTSALEIGSGLDFKLSTTGAFILGSSSQSIYKSSGADAISFNANGAERFRITANGVTFNGDTAAANALDDYEEGTFTPNTAGDPTGAFSSALGEYTKIGNVVHFRIAAAISANFTDNFIGGLPFTVGGSGTPSGVFGVIGIANDNFGDLSALITVGTTTVRTYSDNNLSNQYPPLTTMGTLRMFGTYRV